MARERERTMVHLQAQLSDMPPVPLNLGSARIQPAVSSAPHTGRHAGNIAADLTAYALMGT